MAVSARHPIAQTFEQFGLERFTSGRQPQQPLPAIARANGLGDQSTLLKFAEYSAQRLFGDRQQQQQITDGQAGTPRDEVERAVMGAAETVRGKADIGSFDHISVTEIEQLDSAPNFRLPQEKRRRASNRRNTKI